MPDIPPPNQTNPRTRTPSGPALCVLAVFLAAAAALWASGFDRGRGAFDQKYYHLKAIRGFVSEWPRLDLVNYESATTPGYHIALAAAAKFVTGDALALRIAASLFTVALIWVFARAVTVRAVRSGVSLLECTATCLPLACSMYIVFPGVWLQPDNAGWLGVLVVLLLALRPHFGSREALMGGIVLVLLVLTRQSHVWAASLIWVAAWLNARPPTRDGSLSELFSEPERRTAAALGGLLVTIPALVILAYFARIWHGLTPPPFQAQHGSGFNWSTPPFALSLIAGYSIFLGGWLWPGLVRLSRRGWIVPTACAAAGVGFALIAPTTFLYEPRSSGLWNVVAFLDRHGMVIAGRTSPLIVVLSGVGAVCAAGWIELVAGRDRWVYVVAVAGFVAAQSANANAWQRYLEPFFLMVLPLMGMTGARPAGAAVGENIPPILVTWRVVGPVALAAGLGAITVLSLVRGEELIWPT